MGGVGMGGVGMGGWRIFNSSFAFTVLLGFVMSASAHALTCQEVPLQKPQEQDLTEDELRAKPRAEPKPQDKGWV